MSQDFSGQNLQGKSFKGEDLSGWNFSAADIRGTNFTGAILKGANFSNARAGVDPVKGFLLSFLVWVAAAFTGVYSVFTGVVINPQFTTLGAISASVTVLVLLVIFGVVSFCKNLEWGVLSLAVISAVAGTMATVVWSDSLSAIWTVAGLVIWVWLRILVGVCGLICGGEGGGGFAGFLAWVFGFFAMLFGIWTVGINDLSSLIWGLVVYVGVGVFSGYVCRRSLAGDLRFNFVLRLAVVFASTAATCFRRADLTDANFGKALLGSVDFRQAVFTRTYLRESSFLFRARVEGTILENTIVQNLLVTGNGRNQCFYGLCLKGVNLAGANFEHADLREVNFNYASLKRACLSGANLEGVQLLGCDLSGAVLTGAVLGDWNFNDLTNLDDVVCDYFYWAGDKLKRVPLSGELKVGEFVEWLK